MMLTNKMTQIEQPLEALYAPSEVQDMPDNTGFSALFSSMVAEQEGGAKTEPLPLVAPQVTQEMNDLRFSLPPLSSASEMDSVDELTGQLSSLSLLSSTKISDDSDLQTPELNRTYLGEESHLFNANTEQASGLTMPQLLNTKGKVEGVVEVVEAFKGSLESALEPIKMDLNSNLEVVLGGDIDPQSFDLPSSSAKIEGFSQEVPVEQVFMKEAAVLQGEEVPESNIRAESTLSDRALNQGVVQGAVSSSNPTLGTNQGMAQGTVSWGGQGADSQVFQGFGQQGHASQNGSGQAQQQAMMFAQMSQDKQRSLEQQATVRAVDEAVAKSEGRELLGGADIASLERKGALPLNFQSINVPLKHPQWGQALGQRIVFMSNNNMQQAHITLNPQKLGQIQVMLQLDKDQQMHVSLVAQNGTTRESMENALPRLREMMEQAGIQLGSVNISDQKQFSESRDTHEHNEKNRSQHTLVEEGKEENLPQLMTGSTDNIIDYYA